METFYYPIRVGPLDGSTSETIEALVDTGAVTVATTCIFGDPDSIPLLGAVALEECGLAPDPVRQRLVRVVGLALAGTRR